jgi:hypothetical protein
LTKYLTFRQFGVSCNYGKQGYEIMEYIVGAAGLSPCFPTRRDGPGSGNLKNKERDEATT